MPDEKPSLEATLLQKAQRMGPDPNPVRQESTMSKILELLTGYPSNPDESVGPATMLMAAAPLAGIAGKGEKLATDYASRMQRAKEMGFTHDVYHGVRPGKSSTTTFPEFMYQTHYGDAGIHVDPDPKVASIVASEPELNTGSKPGFLTEGEYYPGANVMPLKVRMRRTLELPDMGRWRDPQSWEEGLFNHQVLQNAAKTNPEALPMLRELRDRARVKMNEYPNNPQATVHAWAEELKNILKRNGYDSIKYKNTSEGNGGYSYMLLDSNQLRSKNALFDPARAKSGDLLASILAGLGLGGAAMSDKDK